MDLSPFFGILLGLLPTNLIMLTNGTDIKFVKGFNTGATMALVLYLASQLVNRLGVS